MSIPLTLTASLDAPPAPAPAVALTASAEARTIAGTIVEYGALGYASTGPTIFEAGSLSFPAELARCKFLLMHDYERPIGTMASLTDDDDRPHASFTVAPGTLGDAALAEAADGRRDGLSVGCMITEYRYRDDGVLIVSAAEVREVSLVTVPAFQNSMVSTVAASLKGPELMTKPLLAPVPLTASTPAAEPQPEQPAQQPAPAQPAPAQPQPAQQPAPATASAVVREPAPQAAPVMGVQAHAAGTATDRLVNATLGYLMTGQSARGLEAAVTDVLLGDDAAKAYGANVEQHVGELWTASLVERPTIDSITRKPLTGLKVWGYVRDRTPVEGEPRMMNRYDFNKTEVPTAGKRRTRRVEADAEGYAGAWDIDRRDIDFGNGELIRATYEGAVDDYKEDTEADVLAKMLSASTLVPAVADVPAALTQLGLRAAGLGSNLTKIQFGAEAWAEFMDLSADAVPWWLQKYGAINLGDTSGSAGGLSFNVNQHLDARQIEAHDSRAATWYEKNPPIRVEAVDIARGGIDLGVYGYGATIINDPRAIFSTTLTAPAAG